MEFVAAEGVDVGVSDRRDPGYGLLVGDDVEVFTLSPKDIVTMAKRAA